MCKIIKSDAIIRKNRITKWSPPANDVLKLNVDGTIFHKQCAVSVNLVLRDSKGEVLLAVSKKELVMTDSYGVELLAILRGMQFCLPMGIYELQIECDSLLVVQGIQAPTGFSSLMGHMLQDVKQLMQRVPKCSIQHVFRDANVVAHKLARLALNVQDVNIWCDDIPISIKQHVWVDKQSSCLLF